MAIARGAGTEIIRCHHFEDMAGTADRILIFGVQHHIYTVLSIIMYCDTLATAGTDTVDIFIASYDSLGGTTGENVKIFRHTPAAVKETFVWNDKFSFNGAEPANFTGPMDDATKQDAIADQGSTPVAQKLLMNCSTASTDFDITVTFIDQNNA